MDRSRPRAAVRLTVYREFESWRTTQNRLRPVLTGLFTPKASQGYAMIFINFKSNFTEFLALFPPPTCWSITCQSPTTTSSAQRHAWRPNFECVWMRYPHCDCVATSCELYVTSWWSCDTQHVIPFFPRFTDVCSGLSTFRQGGFGIWISDIRLVS